MGLYILFAIIYSFLYSQINRIRNFSTEYTIIFNSILGVALTIDIIISQSNIFISKFHLLFIIFLIVQLAIASRNKQYKKDSILKIFNISLITLSPFIFISYIIAYWSAPNKILMGVYSISYFLFLFFYSFVYSQINRIYNFSIKYTIIFNSLIGICFVIDTIFAYLRKSDMNIYLIVIFSISIQLIIASCNKYKKDAQH
ncbi:hypothetical protein K8R61_01870 [bacterium]|nr:hypothetical protein [bacterium]